MNNRLQSKASASQQPVIRVSRVENGIFIRQKECFKKFLFADIQWLEASGNYCYIHFTNRSKIIIVEHLSHIEQMLPVGIFIRIHRSFIVNINSVDGFIGNRLCIGADRLNISTPYRKLIMRCFNILSTKNSYLNTPFSEP